MNSRVSFLSKLSPDRLMVLVVVLGVSFVAIVLLPGLKLAGDLVNSSAALKWVADQERYPTIIRASLETMRDRLTNRGYLQESVEQLTQAPKPVRCVTRGRRSSARCSRSSPSTAFPMPTASRRARC